MIEKGDGRGVGRVGGTRRRGRGEGPGDADGRRAVDIIYCNTLATSCKLRLFTGRACVNFLFDEVCTDSTHIAILVFINLAI